MATFNSWIHSACIITICKQIHPVPQQIWNSLLLKPLGNWPLDARSRPAELALNTFRAKINMSVTTTGDLWRAQGFARLFPDLLPDSLTRNFDHHFQGATREPVTFGFESTAPDGTRRLYDGTSSRISVQDIAAGTWTDIATGMGDGVSRWHAAALTNYILFTNNVDDVLIHTLGTTTTSTIADLIGSPTLLTKAKVIAQFANCIFLMNVTQNGVDRPTRIVWCNLKDPTAWTPGGASIAGEKDLDYGEDILGALQMGNELWVYTTNSIWRIFVVGTSAATPFGFNRRYIESENRTGCLFYPNTLVSDGQNHFYMGRDGIYKFNPYLPAPLRDGDMEWLYRASGAIFTDETTFIKAGCCDAPVARYLPEFNELWISWPYRYGVHEICENDVTLVANTKFKTAYVMDAGFNSLLNFRRKVTGDDCDAVTTFMGASSKDWAWKELGNNVFSREFIQYPGDDLTQDIAQPVYFIEGYNSVIRALLPLGFPDRDKLLRRLALDHSTEAQDEPVLVKLRIGESYHMDDPNIQSGRCQVLWKDEGTQELICPNPLSVAALAAKNQKHDEDFYWSPYRQNRFLYFEITIIGATGLAIGGDSKFISLTPEVTTVGK